MNAPPDVFTTARRRMVDEQIRSSDVEDVRIADAMARVHRHLFVAPAHRHDAYADRPVPFADGHYLPEPYLTALWIHLAEVRRDHRVLQIGTGSGYLTAVLCALGAQVHTVESDPSVHALARANLEAAHCSGVYQHLGDGRLGWSEASPFDAILVSASSPEIPVPLKRQLGLGGRLVIPVGPPHQQLLTVVTRLDRDSWLSRDDLALRVTPLRPSPEDP